MAPPGSTPRAPLKPGSTQPRARTLKDRAGTVPPDEPSNRVRENLEAPAVSFTKKEQQQVDDLTGMYSLIAVLTSAVRKDVGVQIMENGKEAAEAWVTLGQRNPKVRAMIDSMTSASVWAAVLAVHMRMLAPAISIPVMTRTATPTPPPDMEQWIREATGGPADPAALDLAMQMMTGQQPAGTGGPTDTVAVSGNGSAPIGSAEYKAPPMDLSEYPFPMDASPPHGRDGE